MLISSFEPRHRGTESTVVNPEGHVDPPVKTETVCPLCDTLFTLLQEVHADLHVWCDACWQGMSETEKQAAVNEKIPIEKAALAARAV